ncbi:ATP-binding response regulator [Burkholderia sp. 8Y]|uniref:ATP-binding response regulator n=1 Tax=Burkholderia sp. 8Y TaxID=2653133 RepID=UPI001356900C|nr:hybrid sensor histidine kinase/response regulator [Burkholderia sp. 8Y]
MTNYRSRPQLEPAEQKLDRLQLAVEAADIGTFFCPLPLGRLYWNARCKTHFWLPADTPDAEVAIDTFYRVMHPEDRERTRAAVDASISSGTPYDIEFRTVSPHGDVRWLRAKGGATFDAGGRAVRFDGITIDISRQKRLEAERIELIHSERQQRLAAQAANAAKETFIAAVSHELRAPLMAVLAWTDLLDRASADADFINNGISVIRRNVVMQARLVDDLMDASRVGSGKFAVKKESVTVTDCLHAVLQDFRPMADEKGVFVADLIAEPVQLFGDGARLQQVFGNLLNNALKHTDRGGKILPSVVVDGNAVRISIADTGSGIPSDRLEQIFQPFVQLENVANREGSGLGLGLAISRSIVVMHGGDITAQSSGPGQGATFTVILPVGNGDSAFGLLAEQPAGTASALDGKNVLLVEDHVDTLEALSIVLRSENAIVTAARSADEARSLLSLNPPDVIISDFSMPAESGFGFIRGLRERGITTPAIALTGHIGGEDERAALDAGFNDYLGKPVDRPRLLEAIVRLLGG